MIIMERRFVLFLVLSFAILLGYYAIFPPHRPPRRQGQAAAKGKGAAEKPKPPAGGEKEQSKASQKPAAEKPAAKAEKAAPAIQAAPEPAVPEQWVTLGSADDADPYRMLVTLTNKGAAVARIELSSPRYCDIDDRSGYLGHLVMDSALHGNGCPVQVVGPGTPAAEAGLKPGDVIKTVNGKAVIDQASLDAALEKTKPKQTVKLAIRRGGKEQTLSAKLRRRPLEVIKPEGDDPLSMLLSLDRVDDLKLATQWARDLAIYRLYADLKLGDQDIANLELADVKLGKDEAKIRLPGEEGAGETVGSAFGRSSEGVGGLADPAGREGRAAVLCRCRSATAKERLTPQEIHRIIARARAEVEGQSPAGSGVELEGVDLRRGTWKLLSVKPDEAVFRRTVPKWGPGDHQDLSPGPRARRVAGRCRLSGVSPGVRDRDSQRRPEGTRGGLSARRPQRLAHRRQLVCHAGDPARADRGSATSSSRSAAGRPAWWGPRRSPARSPCTPLAGRPVGPA